MASNVGASFGLVAVDHGEELMVVLQVLRALTTSAPLANNLEILI